MINVPWDLEEVIPLVDVCARRESGELDGKNFTKELQRISLLLNRRADILGIVHDEKFRNYSGIRKQFYFRVLVAFTDGEKGSSNGHPREIDYQAVRLYREKREVFNYMLNDFYQKYK